MKKGETVEQNKEEQPLSDIDIDMIVWRIKAIGSLMRSEELDEYPLGKKQLYGIGCILGDIGEKLQKISYDICKEPDGGLEDEICKLGMKYDLCRFNVGSQAWESGEK